MKIIGQLEGNIIEKNFSDNAFDGYKLDALSIRISSEDDCEKLLQFIKNDFLRKFILTHRPCFRNPEK